MQGGAANAYVYAGDPINGNDYSGQCGGLFGFICSAWNSITAQPKTTKPNAVGGYLHWLTAAGQGQKIKANTVSWTLIGVQNLGNGKNRTVAVGAAAQGFDASEHIGRVSGVFRDDILKTSNGYRAIGTYTPNTDRYDFNIDPSRGWANLPVAMGTLGGMYANLFTFGIIRPTDYSISFEGSASIDQSW